MKSYTLFKVEDQIFAYETLKVFETVKLGKVYEVPKAPSYIKGVVNLRNKVIPVVDTGFILLGKRLKSETAVVIDIKGHTFCLLVSKVLGILEVEEDKLLSHREIKAEGIKEDFLEACFEFKDTVVFVLNLSSLLKEIRKKKRSIKKKADSREVETNTQKRKGFIILSVGIEWFALPLEEVKEVVNFPKSISRIPKSPSYVMGVFLLRGKEILLISLKSLLSVSSENKERRVVIVNFNGISVGIAVDNVREIKWISEEEIIQSGKSANNKIIALDGGERLALVLSIRELITLDHLGDLKVEGKEDKTLREETDMKNFVVFSVGKLDLALPVEKVKEVIEVDTVTPLPSAPSYIKGMYNLRNSVITVVSLSTRLGLENKDESNRVVVLENIPIGFTVSNLKGILRVEEDSLESVEDSSLLAEDFVEEMIKTEDGRIVFVLKAERIIENRDLELIEGSVKDATAG